LVFFADVTDLAEMLDGDARQRDDESTEWLRLEDFHIVEGGPGRPTVRHLFRS
jgi:hypothetical protein